MHILLIHLLVNSFLVAIFMINNIIFNFSFNIRYILLSDGFHDANKMIHFVDQDSFQFIQFSQ